MRYSRRYMAVLAHKPMPEEHGLCIVENAAGIPAAATGEVAP